MILYIMNIHYRNFILKKFLIRNVVLGAALFRKAGMTAGRRKQSVNDDSIIDGCLPETLSHASVESSETKSQGML